MSAMSKCICPVITPARTSTPIYEDNLTLEAQILSLSQYDMVRILINVDPF